MFEEAILPLPDKSGHPLREGDVSLASRFDYAQRDYRLKSISKLWYALSSTGTSITSTFSTLAAGGPWWHQPINSLSFSSSPWAIIKTSLPVGRFLTVPTMPSLRASVLVLSLKKTPCTLPVTVISICFIKLAVFCFIQLVLRQTAEIIKRNF